MHLENKQKIIFKFPLTDIELCYFVLSEYSMLLKEVHEITTITEPYHISLFFSNEQQNLLNFPYAQLTANNINVIAR